MFHAPFAFLRDVGLPDRRTVGVVSVLENLYVDADALLGILGGFGWLTVHLDAERGEPFTRRFVPDRDLIRFYLAEQTRGTETP